MEVFATPDRGLLVEPVSKALHTEAQGALLEAALHTQGIRGEKTAKNMRLTWRREKLKYNTMKHFCFSHFLLNIIYPPSAQVTGLCKTSYPNHCIALHCLRDGRGITFL